MDKPIDGHAPGDPPPPDPLPIFASPYDTESLDYDPGWMWRELGESMYGVYVYDPLLGVNVYANAEYTRLTGFTAGDFAEMDAEGFRGLFHPDDRDRVQEHMDRVFSQERRHVREVEYRFRTAGGDWIWCLSRDSRLQRSGDQGPVLVGSFLDITERKKTEAELKTALKQQSETNALLDAIFASAPVGLAFWDRDLRFQRINQRLAEMNGLPRSAHIGRRPDELFPGIQDLAAILERWQEIIETGEPWLDVEVQGETPASGPSVWSESFYPIRLEGEILGLAGIVEDITEQRSAEEEREELLSVLRETDRRKDEFLAVLGHELRNPLAALRNGLAVLKELAGDDEGKPVREMMGRQLAHLVRLVDDLLDLSRVSRGKIELKNAPVELGEVVEEAVQLVRPSIQHRGHRLVLQESPSPPPVVGDFERLVQVVGNLLTNAAKFSHEGGEITLSVETRAGGVEVRVRDQGFGVPPEQVETMFEMFTQVPEHRQWTGGGGLGIGLALSRKLTELHGGTLTVRSEGLGHGSEFVVRLPLAVGAGDQTASPPASPLPGASRRVLLVDDNVDAAEALRMLLEMKGHQVRVVHHGAAALEAFQEEVPEVILLDIGLPRMDGLEVARRIRTMPHGADVVICAVTGWGQERDQRRSAEAGFDIHLTKPVDLTRLEAVLRDA
jgi:PAS domain S-box-containing protein